MKLVNGFYYYLWVGTGNCNVYIIANSYMRNGKTCHTIIDPGLKAYERSLLMEMEKDGLKLDDIGLIINTHTHSDHCELNETIRAKTGALLALYEKEEVVFSRMGIRTPKFKADFYLKEGELNLNGKAFKVYHTPGHSPGHTSLYWPGEKVLVAGDVIFYRNTGRVDLPGGSGEELKKSIEMLSRLDVEYLLTGHSYDFPGVVEGREVVKQNFDYVKRFVFPYL